jgi:L-ascorbate metabolism protein UlaG (beta-lactamase superfamily)
LKKRTQLIEPLMQDEQLLNDVRDANRKDDNFRLWWLGQSGFLLQWKGRHLLLDPYLSDSLTRKYANQPTPHIRMTALPVQPGRLGFVDVVTCSHSHTDHLDPETLLSVFEANPRLRLVIPEAEREVVEKKLAVTWLSTIGLDQGGIVEIDGIRIHAVASAHETITLDSAGRSRFLGYVIELGNWKIYHSGDTVRYPALPEILKPFRIDVALLPINGRSPERKVAGNLNAREAAWLGLEIGAGTVIPCHYDMFTFNTARVEDFITAADEFGQRWQVLRCGERFESSQLVAS